MSGGAVVRRWIKVTDPTALTAREALQRALALGRTVRQVSRSEVLAFGWDDAPGDAVRSLDTLVRGTNLVANPNKHRWELAVGTDLLHPPGSVWILVFEPGAGRHLGEVIRRRRLLPFPLRSTRRATLWELDLAGEPEEVRRLAEDLAVARRRDRGLFANPQFQTALVLDRPPTAEAVARVLEERA